MARCQFADSCAFLQDDVFRQMRGLIQRFQHSYCHDNFSGCARYKIASTLGESYVPSPMIPSQLEWAEQILKEHKDSLRTGKE